MQETLDNRSEGLRLGDELEAVHTVMVRGAVLFTRGMRRLAAGEAVHVGNLRRLGRWWTVFVRRHHAAEEEFVWPAVGMRNPAVAAELDLLADRHALLGGDLARIEFVVAQLGLTEQHPGVDAVAISIGLAAIEGVPAAESLRDALVEGAIAQKSVVSPLLASLADEEARRLRVSALRNAPSFGFDLLLGCLQDPSPAAGEGLLLAHMPSRVREQQSELARRYGILKASLLA